MLQPWHDLVLQQLKRVLPRRGLVLVVEAEDEQYAETADFTIDGLDLLSYGRRRADDPIASCAVFDSHIAIRHFRRVLQIVLESEMAEQGKEILAHHSSHHVAGRELPSLFIRIGNEHLAHQPPVSATRLAPRLGRADLHRLPVAGDIGGVEVEAHWDKAALAGKLQLDALRNLGCNEMQGYLFSAAMPAAEISQLLLSCR